MLTLRFRKFSFANKESRLLNTEESGLVAHFEYTSPLTVTEELHFITCEMKLKLPDLTLDIENLLFLAPPSVTWQQLSEVLGWQFLAMCGRGLDDQQLAALRDKFVDHDGLVHWNKFYKCNGPWIWIDGILDLIKKHLLPIWCKGHIMGFVSKELASTLLDNKPSGTFLLRFSESNKEGAITVSWVDRSKPKGFQVAAVEPFTKKELEASSLADCIRTYHVKCPGRPNMYPLLYLYPDIPMDHVFQQYYSTPVEIEGYVLRFPEHASVDNTPPPSPKDMSPHMPSLADMDVDYQPSPVAEVYPDLPGL
ncbi:hypothetical protein CRUP_025198 [Coryphaenoides rupestris]|nr:hypothetical protein CRUP_025198 [Coryphaenoides rupestris]